MMPARDSRKFGVQITGSAAVGRMLRDIPEAVEDKIVPDALMEVAKPIQRDIQLNMPVASGRARRSISIVPIRRRGTNIFVGVDIRPIRKPQFKYPGQKFKRKNRRARAATAVDITYTHEFGSVRTNLKGKRFIANAWRKWGPHISGMLERAVKKRLDKVAQDMLDK